MTDDELSTREDAFVANLLSGMPKRRAAVAATGCAKANADMMASRMLQRPRVAAAVRAGRAAARAKAVLSRDRLIRMLEEGLHADPALVVGKLVGDIPQPIRRWVSKCKMTVKADGSLVLDYEMVSKAVLAKQIADLHGWAAAQKLDVSVAATDPAMALPGGDFAWRDALSDDELARWGHSVTVGNTREAKRLRSLADDRLAAAVTRLKADDDDGRRTAKH